MPYSLTAVFLSGNSTEFLFLRFFPLRFNAIIEIRFLSVRIVFPMKSLSQRRIRSVNALSKSVSIIACGPTNRLAMLGSLKRIGCKVQQITSPADIIAATRIILYGDGLFPDAIARLNRDGLSDAIVRAITAGTPILGVNLGMQLLFSGSEQGGRHTGLAVFADRLVRVSGGTRFPHFGWNTVQSVNGCPLLKGLDMHSFYFLHDYWALDVTGAHVAGITEFGMDFCSVAHRDNVFGVQFCPEKSGEDGIRLLSNFMEIPSAKG